MVWEAEMKIAFGYLAARIGAAVSKICAPKSGDETRRWVANKCFDAIDAANEKVWQSRHSAQAAFMPQATTRETKSR